MKALNRSVILIICNSAIVFIISLFKIFLRGGGKWPERERIHREREGGGGERKEI